MLRIKYSYELSDTIVDILCIILLYITYCIIFCFQSGQLLYMCHLKNTYCKCKLKIKSGWDSLYDTISIISHIDLIHIHLFLEWCCSAYSTPPKKEISFCNWLVDFCLTGPYVTTTLLTNIVEHLFMMIWIIFFYVIVLHQPQSAFNNVLIVLMKLALIFDTMYTFIHLNFYHLGL